jgi:putative aldouronate transport system permease protein
MAKESKGDLCFRYGITVFLCLWAVITIIPLISVIALSFSSKSAVDANAVTLWPVGFTLVSWEHILTDSNLWRSFFVTVISTVLAVFLALLINILIAYPLAKRQFKPGAAIMMFCVIPMILKAPQVPYFLTLRAIGLYDNPLVLVLPHILATYNMAIIRTFFKQLPVEIEEAASIDGCGHFQTLWKIVLPSSKAVLATIALFYGVNVWNQFQHPMMFIANPAFYPLQMKVRQLVASGADVLRDVIASNNQFNETTLGSVAIVFAIIPIIAVYPWLQKYFAKGAMLGSVKG